MNFSQEFVTPSIPNSQRNYTTATSTTAFYMSVFYVNTILGLHVNSYVLWLICKGKGNGISAEFFSLNLALCEIFFCLGSMSFAFAVWIKSFMYIGYFVLVLPFYGRPLLQCLICIERYLAVLHPVSFVKYKPLRYRVACSALAWVTILGFGLLSTLLIAGQDNYSFICTLLSQTLFFITIQLFCSATILKALKYPVASQIGKDREQSNTKKRKAFNLISIFTVSMFIQSIPLCIAASLIHILSLKDFNFCFSITVLISMIMAYVSPVLYIYRIKKQ